MKYEFSEAQLKRLMFVALNAINEQGVY